MNESGLAWGDVWPAVVAIVTGLSTAVVVLWRKSETREKEQTKYLKEQLDSQVRVAGELGELKGRQKGIENLSAEVLQTVHDAIAKGGGEK